MTESSKNPLPWLKQAERLLDDCLAAQSIAGVVHGVSGIAAAKECYEAATRAREEMLAFLRRDHD